ncbi:MAG: DUF6531 domain-containing protein [Butyrivibrio sp.]|nr:DUF6531 domain-containing protein [Butyrivibrio sp.]
MSENETYVKEAINRDSTGGDDDQWWDQAKIIEFFDNCFTQLSVFNLQSTALGTGLQAFINDDDHTGTEAVASKQFMNDKVYNALVETVRAVQILQGMMQGVGFESSIPLVKAFRDELDEYDTAIIKTSKLNSVIADFSGYNSTFISYAETIKGLRDDAKEVIDNCDVTAGLSVTEPEYDGLKEWFDDFAKKDTGDGFVKTFRDQFLDFIEAHNDDFSEGEFEDLILAVNTTLDNIINNLGDGVFDPGTYEDKLNNIETGDKDTLNQYKDYIDTYTAYLNGDVPRCQVYKYDPINMNNGNFVSRYNDLTIMGRKSVSVTRFYNALSERIGVLGKGWTLNFEEHLSKTDDGFKLLFGDGKEGTYEKVKLGSDEVFMEIHGEPGILTESETGYKIVFDNGDYKEFDKDGFIVAFGKNNIKHTIVEYNIFAKKNSQGTTENIPLPIKIVTKEGSFFALSYNEAGLLVKVKDHAGREVSYRYEDSTDPLRLTSIVSANGQVRSYTYTEDGLIASSVRPDGVVGVVNEYDTAHRIIRQTMPDGGVYNFSYDDKEHITHALEPNGLKVDYLSDELGRHVGTLYPEQGIKERFTYNSRGQKTSYTNKNGFTTRYTYDNRGHLTGIIGPEGYSEFYTYNAEGRLYSKKDADGNAYKFTYDMEGNLYSVTNPAGNKVRMDYEDGRVVAIRGEENTLIVLSYDERGNISTIVDANGVKTEYECDDLGRVVATKDAYGAVTRYEFDEADNLTRVTDPEGNVTAYEYNRLGKVSAVINPDGTRKTWEYGILGKPVSYTDEDNRTTRVSYNISGREEKIVLPNNGNVIYEYDLLGNITKLTDPDGIATAYTYDKAGNILTINKEGKVDIDGVKESVQVNAYSYDGLGRIKNETDGNGNVTAYEYDTRGNLTKVITPNGGETTREYDFAGRLVKETDPLGRETLYSYDKGGRLKTITDSYGVITENTYEKNRLAKVTRKADGEEITVVSYEYEEAGRISKETQTDGFEVTYSYTPNGNIREAKGSNGRTVAYTFDKLGRVESLNDGGKVTYYTYTGTGKLKSVTDPLGNRTEYTYDELDLLCKVERFGTENADTSEDSRLPGVDNEGHVTVYEHSLGGNIISATDALGQKDTYTYDVLGKLKTHIDRDGFETVYTRDNNGNITGINYSDGKRVTMSYNALNILQEVQDHLGLTRIESDILGRKTGVTDYKGRTVGYEYGPYDYRSALIYPDGKRAEYSYDSFGRLISLKDTSSDEAISYSYDAAGRLSERVFPNGTASQMEYYQGGLLKSLTNTDKQGVLDSFNYNYESGLLTDVARTRRDMEALSGSYHYEYDGVGRLIQSTLNGELRASYQYDAFGNRTAMTEADARTSYEYDVLDRLIRTTITGVDGTELKNSYSYDKRGNQTAVTSGDIIRKTFSYDATGKMVSSTDVEKGDISYSYNGLGFRVEQVRPEEKIEYLCDISRAYFNMLERTINGQTESFVYDNNVVSMSKGGDNYYYLMDELGSTMYLTGTDGLTVNAYAYDDFGRRVDPNTGRRANSVSGNRHAYTKSGNVIQPFAFIGYQEDEVSDLCYAQARYYDPVTGRFNGEDTLRGINTCGDSHNRYLYCLNIPTIYQDLNGMWIQIAIGAVVGAVYGAGSEIVSSLIAGEKPTLQGVVCAAVGGAVGGAVTAATGNPVAGAAAGSVTTDLLNNATDYIQGDKQFTKENVLKDVENMALHAGTSMATAYLGQKAGELVGEIVLDPLEKAGYDVVDDLLEFSLEGAKKFFANGGVYIAYEFVSGIPGLVIDTAWSVLFKCIDNSGAANGDKLVLQC